MRDGNSPPVWITTPAARVCWCWPYRGARPVPGARGRTVILVHDGLATGSTMLAAATALRQRKPARIVVGVPVASPDTCDEFRAEVDEIVCVITPEPFYGVGLWYADFSETTDGEVQALLASAAEGQRRHAYVTRREGASRSA